MTTLEVDIVTLDEVDQELRQTSARTELLDLSTALTTCHADMIATAAPSMHRALVPNAAGALTGCVPSARW